MSSSVVAVVVIVLVVITGVAAYYVGTSSAPPTTSTVVSTSTLTSTTISTNTVTSVTNQATLAQAECAKQTNNVCLTIYSTMDTSTWTATMGPLFYQQYPWAQGKVQFVALSAAQTSTRTISEFKANAVQADIIEGTIGPFYPNILAGAIQNYTSPLLAQQNYSKTDYDSHGAWAVVFWSPSTIVYNPKVLAAKNIPVPKTYADLGNPIYKGLIDFQTGTNLATTGSVFYWLYTQMGNASWTQLMKSIAANNPTIATSGGAVTNNAVTGQYPIGIGIYSDYLAAKATPNVTVSAVTPNPTLVNPAVVGIAKNAPHPQMARLLEDWWLSTAGQASFGATDREPYNYVLAQSLGQIPAGIPVVNAWGTDINTVFSNANYWSTLYKNLFGG